MKLIKFIFRIRIPFGFYWILFGFHSDIRIFGKIIKEKVSIQESRFRTLADELFIRSGFINVVPKFGWLIFLSFELEERA